MAGKATSDPKRRLNIYFLKGAPVIDRLTAGPVRPWHSSTTKHPKAKDEHFEVLATNYADRRRRKLAEAMFIRDRKPSLNIQKESYRLKLFD